MTARVRRDFAVSVTGGQNRERLMTALELQDIRTRVRAASAGPWSVQRIPNSFDSQAGDKFTHPCVRGFRVPRRLYNLAWQQVEADAEFISCARQDVPTLIDEIDHMRSVVEETRVALAELIERQDAVTRDELSRIEEFVAAEAARWDDGQKAKARKLHVTQAPMRPKDPAAVQAAVSNLRVVGGQR
jgi:hypothetical protein